MGPFQICGCPFSEPRVSEIAHGILVSALSFTESWPCQFLLWSFHIEYLFSLNMVVHRLLWFLRVHELGTDKFYVAIEHEIAFPYYCCTRWQRRQMHLRLPVAHWEANRKACGNCGRHFFFIQGNSASAGRQILTPAFIILGVAYSVFFFPMAGERISLRIVTCWEDVEQNFEKSIGI